MKTIDRYLIRELIVPFLIGTLAVVLMFQANTVIAILKNAPPQATPLAAIFQIILYKTPFFLNMTLPVGMSLAASLAISRLTRETELTAMRSAGAPIMRIIMPVAFFGALVAVGNYLVVEKLMPGAERRAREVYIQATLMAGIPEFKSNVTFNLRNYSGSFGTVTRNKEGTVIQFTSAVLFERPRSQEVIIYWAETGEYRDGLFLLRKASIWRLRGISLLGLEVEKDVPINERVAIPDVFMQQTAEEQTAAEIRRSIDEGKKIGRDMTSQEVAYHVRFSVPASCLIFAIVAPIFAVMFARTGAFVGVLLSLILVLMYYNVFIISTEIFGRNGILSPFLSAWLPNFIFVVLGIIGIRRLE